MTGSKSLPPLSILPMSRRRFLAGASAAPALQGGAPGPRSVAARAQAWNTNRDVADQLNRRWQTLETDLQRRTRSLTYVSAAARGDLCAQEMRAIDARLPALFAADETMGEEIAALPCRTLADALAKLQMVLRLTAPYDSEGPSWSLLNGAYEDLQRILGPVARGRQRCLERRAPGRPMNLEEWKS